MILPTASGPSQPPPAPTPKKVTTSRPPQVRSEPPPVYSDGVRSYYLPGAQLTVSSLKDAGYVHTVQLGVVFVLLITQLCM